MVIKMKKNIIYLLITLNWVPTLIKAEVFLPEESHQFGKSADLASVPPFVSNIKGYQKGLKQFEEKKQREAELHETLTKHGLPRINGQSKAAKKGATEKKGAKDKKRALGTGFHAAAPEIDKNVLDALTNIFNDKELNEKKITIRTKPSPVIDIIEMVGRLAGIDFVIDSDVTGTTGKINCKECTAGEILNFIAVNNTPKLAVVKYLNLWRVMLFSKAINLVKTQLSHDYTHHIFKIYNAKFDDKFKQLIEEMWKKITGPHEKRAYISFDAASRKIFVYALKQHVEQLQNFIREIDRVVPQVRIDVVIVIADKSYFYDFGFNISGVYDRQQTLEFLGKRFGFAGLGGESVPNESGVSEPLAFALNLFAPRNAFFDVPAGTTTPIKIPILFGGPDLNKRRLDLELNAAESQNKLKILSRPSVLTNSGETVDLLIGESIPISTVVEDVIEGKIRNVTTINFKDIGTELKVTPIVNMEKRMIHLNIFIQDTEIKSGNTNVNSTGVLETPPTIATIRTTNRVELRSGQTTIIGGLVKNSENKFEQAVPFLHRLPILGWLFKSTSDRKLDEERLIFITPTIIEHDA